MSSEMVLKEARGLPIAEQIELCRNLWNGIQGQLTPGEAKLIDRRLQDHPDNPEDVISLEEAKGWTSRTFHPKKVDHKTRWSDCVAVEERAYVVFWNDHACA